MADEKEEVLQEQKGRLEQEARKLAERMQELVGIDCSSGACVFDPEMQGVEDKIEEVRKRMSTLDKVRDTLEACERES